MLTNMKSFIRSCWNVTRKLSGDDAYERYLQHMAEHHHGCDHGQSAQQTLGQNKSEHSEPTQVPLSRKEFFKQWQDNKWTGVKRCC